MRWRLTHPADRLLLLAEARELAPARLAAVERHVSTCTRCRTRLAALTAAAEAFDHTYEESRPPRRASAARVRGRLQAAMHAAEADPSGRRVVTGASRRWLGAAAVAVLAGVTLGVAWQFAPGHRLGRQRDVERAALPVPALTPGATRPISVAEVCAGSADEVRVIAPSLRQAILQDYGMVRVPDSEYELDHLITPELGGASDRRNLWPERYSAGEWNARVKDQLEDLLPRLVCSGSVDLETAQRDIAANWIAAYKKYFRTDRPVPLRTRSILARSGILARDESPEAPGDPRRFTGAARPGLFVSPDIR